MTANNMMDEGSSPSCGTRSLDGASISSQSSKGILKKKTVKESLESELNASVHSIGTCVTFDSVEISEHPITLGVNPAVADGGPPIEIEWESQSYEMTSVDDFEQARSYTPRTIRKLPAEDRIDLLLKSGFTREELKKSQDEMSNARLLRAMSSRRVRRCNSAPPSTTGASSLQPREKGKAYGKLIKRFRLRRSENKAGDH